MKEINVNINNIYNWLVFIRDIYDKRTSIYKEANKLLNNYSSEEIVKICNNILNNE